LIADRRRKRPRIDFKSFSRLGSEQVEARGVEIELRDPFAQRERTISEDVISEGMQNPIYSQQFCCRERERGGEESS
jgi:hypothetical protein